MQIKFYVEDGNHKSLNSSFFCVIIEIVPWVFITLSQSTGRRIVEYGKTRDMEESNDNHTNFDELQLHRS